MTTVMDLMELYRILERSDDTQQLLRDIFTESALDSRIDRDILADAITTECGSMFPRWNTTVIFKRYGVSTFKRKNREIARDLDALALSYNPLYEYDEYGAEIIDETIDEDNLRTDNLKSERTDDLKSERTDDLEDKRTDNLKSERTDDLEDKRTDNLKSERTDDLEEKRTDDLADTRTLNYSETTTAGTGSQTDHYVSADNESALSVRSRDVTTVAGETVSHSGTDTMEHSGSQTTDNTGTQTTEDTGTQTTEHSGTQTTEDTGTQTTAHSGTQTVEDSGTQTTEQTGTQRNDKDIDRDFARSTEKHGRRRSGAEMIREEILANHYDIYERIVEIFVDNMCMGVY